MGENKGEAARAEKALSERLQAVLAAVPDIVMETNPERVYTWANQAGYDFFGEDVLGKEASSFSEGEPDGSCRVHPPYEEDGNLSYTESWQRRRDGEIRLLAWRRRVFRDEAGRVTGALSTARDITDRTRMEADLRASAGRYRTLVQALPDAIIVTDVAGRILDASRQTALLFGFEKEKALIGRLFFDLVAPESKARAVIYLHKTLKEGISRNLEYILMRSDGTRFVGEVNTAVLRDDAGRPEKFVATARDVTARRKADENLRKSLREKELLLQEIHHRVKNNLQIIASLLDLSRMRLHETAAVELISDACSRIQSMAFIHSQLYRTESIENIEMGEHVRDLVEYLSDVYAGDKRVVPHIDIRDVRLSLTQAVPCALVLNELISNAFKHGFGPGETGTIEIHMRISQGRRLKIRIQDDGRGIQDDIDITGGDSLGLKLVRNLVERQLKGSIRVRRDRFTEFTIEFPLEEVVHDQDSGGG